MLQRSTVHIDAGSTAISVAFAQRMEALRVFERLAPTVNHTQDGLSGKYFQFGLESFYGTSNVTPVGAAGARAINGRYPANLAESLPTATYTMADYGHGEDLDDALLADADAGIDLEQVKLEKIARKILRDDLQRIVDIMFDSADLTTGATLSGDEQWNSTMSDPLGDFDTASETIHAATGLWGDPGYDRVLAVADNTWNRIRRNSQLVNQFAGIGEKLVKPADLRDYFDDVVIVPAVKGNAKEGATATITRTVAKHACIFLRPKSPSKWTAACVYAFQKGALESGFTQESEKVRRFWSGHYRTEKLVSLAMAYLYTNAIA